LVVLSFSIFLAICLLIVSILIIGRFVFFYIFGHNYVSKIEKKTKQPMIKIETISRHMAKNIEKTKRPMIKIETISRHN
jgi:hypothetical protein